MSKILLPFISILLLHLGSTPVDAAATAPQSSKLQNEEAPDGKTMVVWKDMTIPERAHYESLVVMSGKVEVFGKIDKLVILGGKVSLKSGAAVTEKAVILGGSIEQAEGSRMPQPTGELGDEVGSQISQKFKKFKEFFHFKSEDQSEGENTGEEESRFSWIKAIWAPFWLALPLAGMVILALLALAFFSMAPTLSTQALQTLKEHPFSALGWGSVSYLMFFPLILFLLISIIGIPLVPFVVFFAILVVFAGFVASSRVLGELVLSWSNIQSAFIQTFLGILILVGLMNIPFLGGFLGFLLIVAGTGAVLRSSLIFSRFSRNRFDGGPQVFRV